MDTCEYDDAGQHIGVDIFIEIKDKVGRVCLVHPTKFDVNLWIIMMIFTRQPNAHLIQTLNHSVQCVGVVHQTMISYLVRICTGGVGPIGRFYDEDILVGFQTHAAYTHKAVDEY